MVHDQNRMNLYVSLNVKIPIELHKSIFFGLK